MDPSAKLVLFAPVSENVGLPAEFCGPVLVLNENQVFLEMSACADNLVREPRLCDAAPGDVVAREKDEQVAGPAAHDLRHLVGGSDPKHVDASRPIGDAAYNENLASCGEEISVAARQLG